MSALLTLGSWMFMVHAKLAVIAARMVDLGEKVEKAAAGQPRTVERLRQHETRLETHDVQFAHVAERLEAFRRAAPSRAMKIRDRVKELRRVKAGQLRPHPKNWRTHPQAQRDALCGVLAEIGYADALLARELPDGSLQLIDGHLRAETTPDAEVPVLVVDLDDRETAKLLASARPAGRHGRGRPRRAGRVAGRGGYRERRGPRGAGPDLLAEPEPPADEETRQSAAPPEVDVPEAFQIVVECDDEAQQQELSTSASRPKG